MKNYKRLFSLIKCKLHWFFISLLMVILIQGLAFISPLLVKVVLDDYILGIEFKEKNVKKEKKLLVASMFILTFCIYVFEYFFSFL